MLVHPCRHNYLDVTHITRCSAILFLCHHSSSIIFIIIIKKDKDVYATALSNDAFDNLQQLDLLPHPQMMNKIKASVRYAF